MRRMTTSSGTFKPTIQTGLLITIMLIAAVYRFAYISEIEHNVDHAYPVWQALQTLDRGVFPLTGQETSVLVDNPALTGYLFVPLMGLTRSIYSVYVFVIALNTAGVLLTYHAARHLIGARMALIAAFLMAVNPWVIEYSRYSWPPALLVFFLSLVAWLYFPVLMGTAQHPGRRIIAAIVAFTLMTQTTLIAFIAAAPVLILLVIFRKRIPWRSFFAGSAVLVVVVGIYGAGLLANQGAVQNQLEDFSEGNQAAELKPDAAEHAFRLVTGADYEAARGVDAPQNDAALRGNLSFVATSAVGLLMLLGIVVAGLTLLRPGSCQHPPEITESHARDAALILFVWFGFPVLLMSYNAVIVHPYYLLLTLPAGYILAAWGIAYVLNPFNRGTAALLLILAIPFAALMGLNNFRNSQETAANPGIHDLGALPLDWGTELGRRINQHLPEGGVLFADVDEWTMNSLAGRTFRLIRDVRAPQVAIIPQGGGLYLVAHPPEADTDFIPDYAERVDTLTLPDGWSFTFDQYPPDVTAQLSEADIIPGEKWISLLSSDLRVDGNQAQLTLLWRVESLNAEISSYTFVPFAHLFNAEGERIAIVDGQGIPGSRWREGDVHRHRLIFDVPDEATQLQIGQFDGVQGENIIFILPDGSYSPTIPLDF